MEPAKGDTRRQIHEKGLRFMKKEQSIRKRSVIIFLFAALNSCAMLIPLNYISYIYTDVAGVDYRSMSVGMSVTSIIGLVVSLFVGMLIQKTKTRLGQFRPWIIGCGLVTVAGTFMTLLHFGSPLTTCVFITIGYCLASVGSDTMTTANYGIIEKFTLGDNDARNSIMAANMAGNNVGYTLFAAILLTLVEAFGRGDEARGFLGAEAVIAVSVFLAILLVVVAGKHYDRDNRKTGSEDMGAVSVKEMLSGALGNRPLIAVLIAEILQFTGYTMFTYMMVYQCTYVLGDLNFMTITLTAMSVICAVAGAASPYVVKLCRGRKRAYIAMMLLLAASYGVMMFTGDTLVGFLLPFVLACFFEGAYMGIAINCYLDAGEWWYDKTGKDTRAYIISLQAIAGKVGMAVSSVLLGVALGFCQYSDELGIATEAGLRACTIQTGLYACVTCAIAALVMAVVHGISDGEMEACIGRNAERDGYLMEQ